MKLKRLCYKDREDTEFLHHIEMVDISRSDLEYLSKYSFNDVNRLLYVKVDADPDNLNVNDIYIIHTQAWQDRGGFRVKDTFSRDYTETNYKNAVKNNEHKDLKKWQ